MDLDPEMIARVQAEHDAAFRRLARMGPDLAAREWLVSVPPYNAEGVVVDRWVITAEEATRDKIRAAFNPQRADRSVDEGTYTRLTVDGVLWMTDTPAEIRDLVAVDTEMAMLRRRSVSARTTGSALIVGLGLGVLVHRAIVTHRVPFIDVVEIDPRVIKAVGPHYQALADEHEVALRIHEADIHAWRPSRGAAWDIGWFDIWPNISTDDMPEVRRLRERFRPRLGWFGAWGQEERIASNRRVRTGKGFY